MISGMEEGLSKPTFQAITLRRVLTFFSSIEPSFRSVPCLRLGGAWDHGEDGPDTDYQCDDPLLVRVRLGLWKRTDVVYLRPGTA